MDTIGFYEQDELVLFQYDKKKNQYVFKLSFIPYPGVLIRSVKLNPGALSIQLSFDGISSFQTFQYIQEIKSYSMIEELKIAEPYELLTFPGDYCLLIHKTLGKIFLLSICPHGCEICDGMRICSRCQEGYVQESDNTCRRSDFCFKYMDEPWK